MQLEIDLWTSAAMMHMQQHPTFGSDARSGQGKAGQGRAMQAGQGRAMQDKAGQCRAGQGSASVLMQCIGKSFT